MGVLQEGCHRNPLNVRIRPFRTRGFGLIATLFLLLLALVAVVVGSPGPLAAQEVGAEGAEHDRDRRAEVDSLAKADSLAALEAAERAREAAERTRAEKRERTPPTTLSGYMEIHYNNFRGGSSQLDFHRFVLLVGHEFSERIRFYSELEVEHAFVGAEAGGELELEQAFVDFHLDSRLVLRVGIMLVPVGILNERHEPPAFFGVERHQLETVLVPTTWFEPGVGAFGRLVPGLYYKLYLLGSLDARGFGPGGIRGGRTKAFKTNMDNPAVVGRLTYGGLRGLDLGASVYRGDAGHGVETSVLVTLLEADARWRGGPVELRGIWVHTRVGTAQELNLELGREADDAVAERMGGFGLQAAVHLLPSTHPMGLAAFARYEEADTQRRVPEGFQPAPRFDRAWWTVGLSFWPDPDVVLKADYQFAGNGDPTVEATDSFNIGLGWWF